MDFPIVGVEHVGQQGGDGETAFEKFLADANIHRMGEWYRIRIRCMPSNMMVIHICYTTIIGPTTRMEEYTCYYITVLTSVR